MPSDLEDPGLDDNKIMSLLMIYIVGTLIGYAYLFLKADLNLRITLGLAWIAGLIIASLIDLERRGAQVTWNNTVWYYPSIMDSWSYWWSYWIDSLFKLLLLGMTWPGVAVILPGHFVVYLTMGLSFIVCAHQIGIAGRLLVYAAALMMVTRFKVRSINASAADRKLDYS